MPPRSAGSLPSGAVTAVQSYLTVREQETSQIGPFVPFLVAFGVIGLVMSVLIVANVVSGAVVSGYRRIGILKSIGFTPGQVVAAYTAQVTGARPGRRAGRPGGRRPAGHDAAAPGRERLRRGPAQRAGVGGRGRARGHARPGRRSRPCCRPWGRPGSARCGHRRGPGAPGGPRLRRAPAARAAAAAAAGDDRAGGPVRPPGPYRDHAGRRAPRGGRGDLRDRPGQLAEPGGGRPVALGR